MKIFARLFIIGFFVASCGDTSLEEISLGGSTLPSVVEVTSTPVVFGTSPTSPNLSQSPQVIGSSEPSATVRIFSDSACSLLLGSGTADLTGEFSVSLNSTIEGGASQTFFATAQADEKSVSECSITSTSYRSTAIRPGLAWLTGTQTSAPGSPTQVNQATAYAIQWSQSEFDSNFYDHSTTLNSQAVTIKQDGDYLLSATLPLQMTAGTYRPCVRMEVRVNGVLISGGIGQSTYIRYDPPTGNTESSGHVSMLLQNLSSNDVVEIFLQETAGEDGSEVVSISSVATLSIENIASQRNFFTATATRTVASTNINGASSPFEWTPGRSDSGFSHSGVTPENIVLTQGNYLAWINIPINSAVTRSSQRVKVRLNGSVINGGQASQGYIRSDSGHNDSSIHWFGHFSAVDNDVLTVTSESEAGAGVVNIQAGQTANINIEKLSSDEGLISLRATGLLSGISWNNGPASAIAWTIEDNKDSQVYGHSTIANQHQITINEPGDYILIYNDSLSGTNDRVSPIIRVQVNGSDIPGAESKTHYIRNTSGHNESSATLTTLLRNRSAGDVVTLTSEQDVAAGVVNSIEDALLTIIKK